MDYTTLIGDKAQEGSIKNWVNHALIPSSQVITEAEAWIYQKLRVRQMVQTATGTYTNGDAGVLTLPTRYRAPIYLELKDQANDGRTWPDFTPDLAAVHQSFGYDGSGNRTTGAPTKWGTNATQAVFDTYAPSGTTYDYTLLYYGALAALAASTNETNFLTDRYPRLFRTVLMAFAYEFQEDDRRAEKYLVKSEMLLREVEVEKDLEFMGANMQMNVPGGEFSYSS